MSPNRNRRAWPPSPPVHTMDISGECFVCGGRPTLYLEVLFVKGHKATILDNRHAPICGDTCATAQYLELAKQGFFADSDYSLKRLLSCEKTEDSPQA